MNIIELIEAELAKVDGGVKAAWADVLRDAKARKDAAQRALEAEVAKGSTDLQARWASLKAYL